MMEIFPIGTRVVGYARDSGGDSQDLSIAQQSEQLGKFCVEHDLILSRIYEDVARSGATTVGRHQFLEMVDYLTSNPKESGLVVWELSRIARDYNDTMFYLADLKRHGVAIHSISDAVPPGLEGDLLLSVKSYSNAVFLRDLRKNVRRGMHYVVRQHNAHIGHVPVGYTMVSESIGKRRDGSEHIISHLAPDAEYGPLVRRAFELRAQGWTYKEIDRELHLFPWLHNYNRLFKRRLYTGVKYYGGEIIEAYCPPLVSQELWDKVQVVQAERASRVGYNHPRVVRSNYWLSGSLFCAVCGMPMHAHSVTAKGKEVRGYYKCSSRVTQHQCTNGLIPKLKLEEMVMAVIHRLVEDDSLIDEVYEEAQAQLNSSNHEHDILRQRDIQNLQSIEQEISRVLAAIKSIGHSRALLDELGKLENRQLELQQSIMKVEVVPQVVPISRADLVANIGNVLNMTDEKERGIILREMVKRVEAVRLHNKPISGQVIIRPLIDGELYMPL